MHATFPRAGALALMLVAAGIPGLGCQNNPSSPEVSEAPSADADPLAETRVVIEPAAVSAVIVQTLQGPDAAAGRRMLEAEGYALVDTNSVVLIRRLYDHAAPQFEPQSRGLGGPRRQFGRRLLRADTVVWLAFENPASDPANHTAIVIGQRNGAVGTRLIELDVASEPPTVIREGDIAGGVWQPGDVGTDSFLACLGAGLTGSAWRCALTNCGWAHCMGIGASVTVVGCGAAWAFGAFD